MVKLYIPKLEDLWFRQKFMSDEETMSYNHNWGGTIPFPEEDWNDWYECWIVNPEGKRFYRYLQDESNGEFVGEIAYHYDQEREIHIADIIVYAKYRGNGFGEQGLLLLCEAAKANGVEIPENMKIVLDCSKRTWTKYNCCQRYCGTGYGY